MITLLKDYTCYNADIAAIIVCTQENSQRLKVLINAVNNQCFPASEKIILFKRGTIIPDWFAGYPDWDYRLCSPGDVSNIKWAARAFTSSTWVCVVDSQLPGNCFLLASEKMQMTRIPVKEIRVRASIWRRITIWKRASL